MIKNDNFKDTGWRVYAHSQADLDNGKFFISCTTVLEHIVHKSLKKYFQTNSAAKQEKVLTQAASQGTDIHELIENYENARLEGVQLSDYDREQIKRWEEQKAKNKLHVVKTEYTVWNEYLWIAGTADYICQFDKDGKQVLGIGDLKTGRYDIKAGWQMAFYLKTYQQIKDQSARGMIGINLPRDLAKTPNSFIYEHVDSCWNAYLAAWQTFRMVYWNELKKLNWRGLDTVFECNVINLDKLAEKEGVK